MKKSGQIRLKSFPFRIIGAMSLTGLVRTGPILTAVGGVTWTPSMAMEIGALT